VKAVIFSQLQGIGLKQYCYCYNRCGGSVEFSSTSPVTHFKMTEIFCRLCKQADLLIDQFISPFVLDKH
jgi:hypothetical protein